MTTPLETPSAEVLAEFGIRSEVPGEPWIRALDIPLSQHETVTISWDEIAASISILWKDGEATRLRIDRETVSKITLSQERGATVFTAWYGNADLRGQLLLRVGETVQVQDQLLRA